MNRDVQITAARTHVLRPCGQARQADTAAATAKQHCTHLDVDFFGVVGAPRPLHAAAQLASVFQESQRARQACTQATHEGQG